MKKTNKSAIGGPVLFEELEPRLLLSADFPVTLPTEEPLLPPDGPVLAVVEDALVVEDATSAESPLTPNDAEYVSTPLTFEANEGQTDSRVDFLARGSGYNVYLTEGDAVLALGDGEGGHMLRMNLVGANENAAASGLHELTSRSNYLIGPDLATWTTDIENYGRVQYRNVYEGIDVHYYGNERQLEYDFILHAGASPDQIRLSFDGARALAIDVDGDLVVTVNEKGDEVRFQAPITYQDGESGRETIESKYVLSEDGQVGFEVHAYDTSRPLVIDPILEYGTYLGGTGNDSVRAIAIDTSGDVYVAGRTNSPDFPTTAGPFGPVSGTDVFVSKLSADGTTLLYSTYVGGSGLDSVGDMALDTAGNVYVGGLTGSNNFPVTVGAQDMTFGGTEEGYVFKLNSAGTILDYATYIGQDASNDAVNGIAIDATGRAYLTGQVGNNVGFVTTAGAYQTGFGGGATDAFFSILSSDGSAFEYSTYFGGSTAAVRDAGSDIAIDGSGRGVIVGYSESNDLPTAGNAHQTTNDGGKDVFVAVINPAGGGNGDLIYSSYLGGSGNEVGLGVNLHPSGIIHITGDTTSTETTFDLSAGAFQNTYGGGTRDAFYATIDTGAPTTLAYSTFIGGSGNDSAEAVVVEASGIAFLTGLTESADFPTSGDAYDASLGGTRDAFLVGITPSGGGAADLRYATYLGGATGNERGFDVTLDSNGNILVAGETESSDFDTTAGAYDESLAGTGDGFLAKFSANLANGPTLWISADEDSASGADGLPGGWTQGEALQFGGPDFALGANTDGDFASVIDFDTFAVGSVDTGALHYVSRNITVGSGGDRVDLQVGDVLVSFNQDEDILATFYETGVQTTVHMNDLLAFRPDTVGDYSSGTFYMVLNGVPDPLGTPINSLHAISLVEQDTTVGATLLDAGTFLFSEQTGAAPNTPNHIYHFVPTSAGKTAATGTSRILIDGDDINIENGNNIRGLELIETATSLGGMNFDAGDILVTLSVDDAVVGNAPTLNTSTSDIFVLKVSQAEPEAGNTTAATAEMVLDGSDVNFSGSERVYAIALHPDNVRPLAQDDRVGLSFDGVDDYVQVPNDATLVMNNTFTMEAWINLSTTAAGGSQIILNKEGEYELGVTASTGEVKWAIAEGGAWAWRNTGAFVDKGEWSHVAVTYNAGAVLTYVNGALVHTFSQTGPVGDAYPGFNEFRIGGRENAATQRFEGEIDEVRVWNVTRTEGEIKAAKDGLLTGTEPGLVGYWRFDEGTGSQVFDISPSGNDGTLGGVDAPLAEPTWAGYTTDEETVLTVPAGSGVLSNDIDADGDLVTVTNIDTTGMIGALALNADGSFTYDPRGAFDNLAPGQYATDVFTYTANDGSGDSNTATVTITVTGVNDPPTVGATATDPTFTEGGAAVDLFNAVSIGTVESGQSIDQIVLTASNVTDGVDEILNIDGTAVTLTNGNIGTTTTNSYGYTVALAGNTATVVLTTTGATPAAAETLLDTLSYQNNGSPPTVANRVVTLLSVQDSGGTADGGNDTTVPGIASTVTIDRVPSAANDTNTATEAGLDATGNVITNDNQGDAPATVTAADESGTPITIGVAFATANGGSLTLNSNGSYTYTPPPQGSVPPGGVSEVFNYTITDADGDTSNATLTITVNDNDLSPSAVNDTNTATEAGAPVGGDVIANDNQGDAPATVTAANEGGTPITLGVAFATANGGSLTLNSNGSYTYTPPPQGSVPPGGVSEVFNYTITDADGDTSNATLTITVSDNDLSPSALNDTNTTTEAGAPVGGDVIANDNEGDAPATVTAADESGTPITLGVAFATANGGSLTLNSNGSYTYTPPPQGAVPPAGLTEVFNYTITDSDGDTSSASLTITVNDNDLAPTAVNDTNTATEAGVDATGNVITNDTPGDAPATVTAADEAGTPITIGVAFATANGGSLTLNSNGTYTYAPPPQGSVPPGGLSEVFNYTITDADGDSANATLTITVNDNDLTPTAVADVNTATEAGAPVGGDVIANDNPGDAPATVTAADQGGNAITIGVGFATAAGGTLTLNSDGTYTYAPPPQGSVPPGGLSEVFNYTITDADGDSANATLTITVNDNDLTPTAVADVNTATEAGAPVGGDVIANDNPGDAPATVTAADQGGNAITIGVGFATAAGGTLTLNSDGTYTYAPPPQGSVPPGGLSEVFNYTITDADGDSANAMLTINVTEQNDAPTNAVPGTQNIFQDTSLVFSGAGGNAITVADVDAGANAIEITLVASNGTVTLASTTGLAFAAGDGTADSLMTFTGTVVDINAALNGLRFDPNAGFAGTARLRIVTDDLGNSGSGGPLSDLDEVAIVVEADAVGAPPPDDPPPPPLDEIIPDLTDDPPPPDEEEETTTGRPPGAEGEVPGPLPGLDMSFFEPVSDFAPIEFAERADDDGRSDQPSLSVPLLVKFAPVGVEVEIPLPQAIWALIDDMKDQMNEAEGILSDNGELVVTSAAGLTVTLSAGYVSWLLRAGYLSASLLSAGPLWSQFDPLPVLAGARKKRKEEKEKRAQHQTPDSKVDNLFQAS
jgi:VCBS repeat-containing protein